MESGVVAICTSAASHLSVPVGTGEAGVENYLLETFPILPLEVPYERIVSFPFRETYIFYFWQHGRKNKHKIHNFARNGLGYRALKTQDMRNN
jgi:hypothetical protein